MLPHQPAVLKRHPIGFGELQVGDAVSCIHRHLPSPGVSLLVEVCEPEEAVLTLHGDFGRRAVGAEEIIDVEFVMRDQPGNHLGHFGMSGQRAVFCPRQRQPRLQFGEGCQRRRRPQRRREKESEGSNPCHQR